MPRGSLPPARQYSDGPRWAHNFDNVRVRTVNAAWNALLKRSLGEVSFKELARQVGVTPPALYHHFPDLTALELELATASLSRLRSDLVAAAGDGHRPADTFRAFLGFARQRPHHYALAFSPRFNTAADVKHFRDGIRADLELLLGEWLERAPARDERRTLLAHLHGAAVLVTTGAASLNEGRALLEAAVAGWRQRR